MLIFKRFGHQILSDGTELAKLVALNLWWTARAGSAFFRSREQEELVLIKDTSSIFNITKSVASNLVKRMVQKWFGRVSASPSDKRAKFCSA